MVSTWRHYNEEKERRPGPVTVGRFQVTPSSEAVATAARPPSVPGARAATAPGARPAVVPGARYGRRPGGGSSTSSTTTRAGDGGPLPGDPQLGGRRHGSKTPFSPRGPSRDGSWGQTRCSPRGPLRSPTGRRLQHLLVREQHRGAGRLGDQPGHLPHHVPPRSPAPSDPRPRTPPPPPRDGRNAAAPEHGQAAAAADDEEGGGGRPAETKERPRATHAGSARRRSRKRTCSLSLLGTSADSGLSVTAADAEGGGRLWDGGSGSPQYTNALHHLWTMTYSRSSAPYVSSDAF
ncbi:unnamed protein product [Boreogadus saida]